MPQPLENTMVPLKKILEISHQEKKKKKKHVISFNREVASSGVT